MAATPGPDEFPLADTHPRAAEHRLLGAMLEEGPAHIERVAELMRGRQLLRSVPRGAAAPMVTAALERSAHLRAYLEAGTRTPHRARAWCARVHDLIRQLAPQALPKDEPSLTLLLRLAAELEPGPKTPPLAPFIPALRSFLARADSPIEAFPQLQISAQAMLVALRARAAQSQYEVVHYREIVELIGVEVDQLLAPGEIWAEAVLAELAAMDEQSSGQWRALVTHCKQATASKPSKRWLGQAAPMLRALGHDQARARLTRWLPLVAKGRSEKLPPEERGYGVPDDLGYITNTNQLVLRGLAWCTSLLPGENEARALSVLAKASFRKLRGYGPRSTKLGNAAIWALGNMVGIEPLVQLELLEAKLSSKSAKKQVARALAAAAAREGISLAQLAELATPSYDLRELGRSIEQFGSHHAELVLVERAALRLRWRGPTDTSSNKLPAALEREFCGALAQLRARIAELGTLLVAHRDTLEQHYRHDHSWAYAQWRSAYLDHPLDAALARRLIWRMYRGPEQPEQQVDLLWLEGELRELGGAPAPAWIDDDTRVHLWHPLGETPESVSVWRDRLESAGIIQPFAQLQRELHALREDERASDHSLRVAGRVLRQRPFHELCKARGWHNPLRLSVDDNYAPATLAFPRHELRAELWVEGTGRYGDHTTPAGTYLYLLCEQLRFHRLDDPPSSAHAVSGGYHQSASPLPLASIPARVFSEVTRDVELFCSLSALSDAEAVKLTQ